MSLLSLVAGTSMLVLALMLLARARRQAVSERVVARLDDQTRRAPGKRRIGGLERHLLQAGVRVPLWGAFVLLAAVSLLLWICVRLSGPWTAAMTMSILVVAGYALLRLRFHSRVERMIGQMPALLDHCIRSIKSGRSLGDALLLAMDRAESPLGDALSGVRRGMELGLSLDDVMTEFVELYDRDEFHMLAVSIKVNQRHGGSASDLLGNLIVLIRDRQRAAAQLRALTGETRISAWVLGIMPPALGAYIFVTSPGFFLGLWQDATGRMLLYTAVGLQLTGSLLLWRMLRSV